MRPRRHKPTHEVEKQGPRARDADRDETVDELQAAYVDGQIDADERERRTDLALRASHLEDLRALVDDLQVRPVHSAVPEAVEPVSPAHEAQGSAQQNTPATTRTDETPGWLKFLLGGVAVLAIGGVGVGIAASVGAFTHSDADRYAAAQEKRAHQPSVQWSEVKGELPAPAKKASSVSLRGLTRWSISKPNVQALIDGYREELGTPYVGRMFLYENFAVIDRPVGARGPALETWTYDEQGRFTPGEIAVGDEDLTLMSVDDLNVDRLFANIDEAFDQAELDDVEVSAVMINLTRGQPEVSIIVADPNNLADGGHMHTTLSGDIYEGAFTR